GGLLALSRQDAALASERWSRLLKLDPPESVRALLERQVAALAAEAGEEGSAASPPASQPATAAADGIAPSLKVSVSLDESLAERVSPGAPLFVFVRAAGGAGPPLAVVRESAAGLPLTVQISDEDVMIPGRTLSSAESAEIVARISNGGDALAAPGELYGEATAAVGGNGEVAVELRIDRVVPP